MNTRKWVKLFLTTLALGGVFGLIISFFVKPDYYAAYISPFDFFNLLGVIVFFIGFGFISSLVSQTGFFAYLFINQFGLGLFRTFWPTVQVLLIAFVVFDLVYFPYNASDSNGPLIMYIGISAAILIYGWVVAKIKAKQTKPHAFIPSLFLMVVMTTLEWVPGLQTSGADYAWLMIVPLLACNTYQLLMLHHLNKPDAKQLARMQEKEANAQGTAKSAKK